MGFEGINLNLSCPDNVSKEEYFVQKKTYVSTNSFHSLSEVIKITQFELNLLKLLTYQKFLSTNQLYNIYNHYYPIKYDTLFKKLSRWSKKSFIDVKNFSSEYFAITPYPNVYKIGELGVEMLVENSILEPEWLEVELPKFQTEYQTKQLIGEQEMIYALSNKLFEQGIDLYSYSTTTGYLTQQEVQFGRLLKSTLNKERIFIVEFVVTNEVGIPLNRRIDEYVGLAKSNPNKPFVLLVGLMDKDFPFVLLEFIRPKRKLSRAIKYFNSKELPENLNVFIALSSEFKEKFGEVISHLNNS